jgi:heme/copper-type cytochrome/quinol oxidase subunit 2
MHRWQSIKYLLVIAGICWCVAIFRRRREDVAAFRKTGDRVERNVVIGIWAVTAVVLLVLLTWGVGVAAEFWGMLRGQFRW